VQCKKKDTYTEIKQKLQEKTSRLIQVTHQLRSEINQRQQSQQAYRQASIELEKQVAQRTAELLKVNQELSVSLEEQSVFEEELRQQNEELLIAHENAKLQQRRYEDLFEFAPDAYLVTDANGKIQEANRAASKLFGVSRKYLIGKPIFVFIAKPHRQSFRTQVNLLERVEDWECDIKPRKSTPFNATITITSIHDCKGKLMGKRLMIRDITEKKLLEAQYYRAQRLESLGTLASGIAHDLNNILTPILTGTQLLPRKLPDLDEQNRFILKMLEDNSKRGAELVKQITSFARGAEGDRVFMQIRHLIKEITRIVKSTFPEGIEFSTKIPTNNLWTVEAQPTQIHQILMNLCINARDAMPDGGKLSIAAENRYIDETYCSMNTEAKVGNYVAITVSDTGCGIPQEIKERIFEPFFTTKEIGKGTGLGLSTTIGIVKNYGGFVRVSSQVGKGSQFQIYLPASPNQEIKQTSDLGMSYGNGELILVVDDETYIREMIENSLVTHNYRILTANDGSEAFSFFVKYKYEINLVLIDIQMPSIHGFQVIQVLRQMNPDVKIIAMSGLESNRQLIEANDIKVEAFLPKPYSLGELLEEIKVVLNNGK
jgi:PAS domain S-box-containing protein